MQTVRLLHFWDSQNKVHDMSDKYFHGSQCSKCGETKRYISSHNCVMCAKRNATARYEKKVGGEPPQRKSIVNRKLAIEAGEKTYRSDPCPRGHEGIRDVRNGMCVECHRLRWHIYPTVRVRAAVYRKLPEYVEKAAVRNKEWRTENRDHCDDYSAQKRVRRRGATPSWSEPAMRMMFYDEARRLSKETGVPHHVDHIVPLKSKHVCGLHCETNMRVIPATENLQKRNFWWPDM